MTKDTERMNGATLMSNPALDRRALESYLRFSYPVAEAGLLGGESISYPEIRFSFDPERGKAEYLSELSRILDDILETERQSSDAAFLSSGDRKSVV